MKGTTKFFVILTAAVFILTGCSGSSRGGRSTEALTVDPAAVADCDGIASDAAAKLASLEGISSSTSYCTMGKRIVEAKEFLADSVDAKVCPSYKAVKDALAAAYAKVADKMAAIAPLNDANAANILCSKIIYGVFSKFPCATSYMSTEEAFEVFANGLGLALMDREAEMAANGELDKDAVIEDIQATLEAATDKMIKQLPGAKDVVCRAVIIDIDPIDGFEEITESAR